MATYIINTFLSCLFVYLGTRKKNKKWNIWVLLAIIIPCVVAGARDVTVGTDTSVYIRPLFSYATQVSSLERYINASITEPGFLLYVYAITKLTGSMFWVCFGIELWCMMFIYLSLIEHGSGKYTWIGFLTFHLLFYSFTLNLMRQFMGLSFGLYCFKYIKQHRLLKYYLSITAIVLLVHRMSFVFYITYPMYYFLTSNEIQGAIGSFKRSYKTLFKLLIIVGTIFIIIFASKLMTIISYIFGNYQGQIDNIQKFSIVWTNLVFMIPLSLPLILNQKYLISRCKDFDFYNTCFIVATILWQLQGLSRESYRVSFYFFYYIILMLPLLIKHLKSKSDRVIYLSYYIIGMSVYYYIYFVFQLFNNTYPYTSQMLGIG